MTLCSRRALPGLLFLLLCVSFLPGEVVLDPPVLELDSRDFPEGRFSAEVSIENRDERPLSLSFMSGEQDWSLVPADLEIPPGGKAVLHLSGPLPGQDPGAVLFLSDREDVPYLYTVRRAGDGPAQEQDRTAPEDEVSLFFYTPGCRLCEDFYDRVIPRLLEEDRLSAAPERRNIYDPGNLELLRDLMRARGAGSPDFPVLVFGDRVFQGKKALFEEFPAFLTALETASKLPEPSSSVTLLDDFSGWSLFPLLLAGLLDGINPCAFTTLIFLLSFLRLLGKEGPDILRIGGSFTLGVFLSYFLIGLGLFHAVRTAQAFPVISQIIRIGMILLLIILSGLSFYDYLKIRQGRAGESLLQLSKATKQRIHRTIRNSSRSPLLMLSSFGAGVVISLYELGCTGQIYLPMVVYMVRQDFSARTLFPLFLYNLGFILPLVLVFLLFYRGTDSRRIAQVFEEHMGRIKLSTALLFLGIAVLLILWA